MALSRFLYGIIYTLVLYSQIVAAIDVEESSKGDYRDMVIDKFKDIQWKDVGVGGAVGFTGGYIVKRVITMSFKIGLLVALISQAPLILHSVEQDKWAAWFERKQEQVYEQAEQYSEEYSYVSSYATSMFTPEKASKATEELVEATKPYLKTHASTSGGFLTGFILGLQS